MPILGAYHGISIGCFAGNTIAAHAGCRGTGPRSLRANTDAAAARLPGHVLRHVHGILGHPDRLVVARRDPSRPLGLGRRDSLGADLLSDRRSDRDPIVGIPVARARHPYPVRRVGGRFYARQHHVRHLYFDRRHDRVAGAAGIHRRRHGADGVRLGLPDLPGPAAKIHRAGGRPDRDLGADHRPHGRRLPDRRLFVALAVLHQRRARHHRQRVDVPPDRFRQARFRDAQKFRLDRADLHGGLSRRAGIRARGRPALRMARRRHDLCGRHRVRGLGRGLLCPRAHRSRADRRSTRLRQPQFRGWQPVLLRDRHRPLRADLSLPGLSGAGARLRRADDRRDHVRLRPGDVRHRADRRPARSKGSIRASCWSPASCSSPSAPGR